ncbi:MAG: DUF2096 family protein [Candidatus Thorarchaeota archaeon]
MSRALIALESLAACWTVLNDLLGELTKMGVFIPDLTYRDFRNSKMIIEYLRAYREEVQLTDDPDARLRGEMEENIFSLRQTIMVWAEERQGVAYRREWEEKFEAALRGEIRLHESERETPITELPREQGIGFFRIRLPEDIPIEIVSEIAEECRVIISLDGDNHLLVSGKREYVDEAREVIGEIFYGKSKIE